MQKKILLSLLIATPTALPALADIDMGAGTWESTGVSLPEKWDYNQAEGNLSCVLNSGVVRQVIKNAVPGKYQLSFQTTDNLSVTVLQGDKVLASAKSSEAGTGVMTVDFNVESIGDITIETKGENANQFSFTGSNVKLVVDFTDLAAELNKQIEALPEYTQIQDESFPGASDLLKEKAGLESTKADYQDIIDKLTQDGLSDDEILKIYTENELYKTPSKLADNITALGEDIEAWNEKAAELNTKIQNTADNTQTKADLIAQQVELTTAIDKLIADIKAGPVYAQTAHTNLASAEGLKTTIGKYLDEINAAYADDKLAGTIDFTSRYDELNGEITKIQNVWNGDKADWEAYENFMNVILPKLNNAFEGANTTIDGLQGIRGYENIYEDKKDEALNDIQKIFDEAKADLQIKEPAGAASLLFVDEKKVNNAVTEIQVKVEDLKTLVETQNANATEALAKTADLTSQFESFKQKIVPVQMQEEYDAKVKAIDEALSALGTYIKEEYVDHTLDIAEGSEYDIQVKAIEELLKDFEEFVAPMEAINQLYTDFENIKEYVQKVSDEVDPKGEVINIYDLFNQPDGTFAAIEDAIKNLQTQEDVDNQSESIQNSIDDVKATADDLKTVYTELLDANKAYINDVEGLETFVNGKYEVDANGAEADVLKKAFLGKEYVDFAKTQKDFYQKILDLKNSGTPQDIYNAAKALAETLGDPYYWTPDLETLKRDFAEKVTDSNNAYLEAYITKVKDFVNEGTYTGQSDLQDFTEIDTDKEAIDTTIADADGAEGAEAVSGYADADTQIEALFAKIKTLETTAQKYKDNQKAYDDLNAQLVDLQKKIDALTEKNNNESYDNGKEYFVGVIAGIQGQWDDLKQKLDEALANYADPAKNVTGQQTTLQADVKALGELITKTSTDIDNNNNYHTQQLNKAEEVRLAIEAAKEMLNEYYNRPDGNPQTGIEGWYEDTLAELESLRNNDWYNNGLVVADAYGKGESMAQNKTIMDEYQRILDELNKITGDMLDDYTKAVVEANTATVGESGWEGYIGSMNDQYRISIEQYNKYYYGLTNEGWREYVLPIIKRHERIYEYSQKINKLIGEVNAYVEKMNKAPLVFTADDFAAVSTEKAQAMIDEMKAAVANMNAEAATAAEEYYADLHSKAETQINGYQAQLDAAGITSTVLDGVKGSLKNAEGKYANAIKPDATQALGIAMDRIADDLDAALNTIDLQPVAEEAWSAAYGDATKTVADLLAALEANGDDYKFADEGLSEEAIETIKNIQSEMADLNNTVIGVKAGLIDSYKGYKDQLDELLKEAQDADKKVKDSSKDNLANQELYKDLTGTVIPGFENDLQNLLDYASTLVGGQTFDPSSISNKIDQFKQFVEDNAGQLTQKSAEIESYKTSITDAINNGYGQIGYNEQQYLTETLLRTVKVAFNDAKAAMRGAEGTTSTLSGEEGEETVNGWNDKIDELAAQVADLQVVSPFDKEGFRTEAQSLETQLNDLYVEMEQTWTGENHDGKNPVDAVVAALEKQYGEIAQAIADARDYMAGCEEGLDTTPYANALDAAQKALDAQKEAWTEAGNRVLGMEKTYADAMDAIAKQVADTKAGLEAANEQAIQDRLAKEANEAAYGQLSEQLATLKDQLKSVTDLANEWYPGDYEGTIDSLQSLLEAAENDLNTRYENTQLTADSELRYGQSLANGIAGLEQTLYRRQAEDNRLLAQQALVNVGIALQKHYVPETRNEINDKLDTLQNEYQDNYGKQVAQGSTIEDLKAVIDEYQRIAEAAKNLVAYADEEAFVPGNVDLDPNGLVTSFDVQMMIRWVLDGVTWQDLLAQNPRQAYAADLNGDQDLNITDVTMDISWMFGENPNAQRAARFKAPVVDSNNGISLALVSEENGVRRYALMLDNTDAMIAGQFDLKLPSGMRLVDITTSDRTANHMLESQENFDGVRVVLYSMENAVFEGNSGAIFFIDVEGKGDLSAQKAIFTDSYFQTHTMDKPAGTTLIDSLVDGAKNMGSRIYNAAGMMFDKLQNGLNIFRDKDGKVKKEYNRNK